MINRGFLALIHWRKIILGLGICIIAILTGAIVAKGGAYILIASIALAVFLVVLFITPKIGIWVMPLVAFFSLYDPAGIGYSPEKILMVVVLVFWLFQRKSPAARATRSFRGLLIVFGIYVFVNLLGLLFPSAVLEEVLISIRSLIANGLLIFLTISLLSDIKDLNKCFITMGLTVLIAFGSMILVAFLKGNILIFRIHTLDQVLPSFYSFTVFANPNFAAAYGCLLYPVMFSLGMQQTKGWKKTIFFSLSALAVAGVLLTFSRASLIELLVITVFLLWRFRIRWSILFFAVLFAAGIFLLVSYIPFFSTNITRVLAGQDLSTNLRIDLLRSSWESFKENPILGSGAGSFKRQILGYNVTNPDFNNLINGITAHNDWTNLLVENGALGGGVFLLLLFLYAKELFLADRKIARESPLWFILTGLLGSLIGAGVDSFFHQVLIYNLLWYMIALTLVVVKIANRPLPDQSEV